MKVFQKSTELQKYLLEINELGGKSVGFVPTMGALHEGHLSLISISKAKTTTTVASIFVNPTQFNDINDFNKYPIQIDLDLELLLNAGCDVVFIPSFEEVYPAGTFEKIDLDLGRVGSILEAANRPGHFEGVIQVVKRLLDIVQPDVLFLGQKDYQQCCVISKLITHFQLPVKLEIADTVREIDGLAMSSRNMRLNTQERQSAIKLSKALFHIREHLHEQDLSELILEQKELLATDPLIHVSYLEAVKQVSMEPLDILKNNTPMTLLIAAKVGEVRLIDNILISSSQTLKIPEIKEV